MSVQDLGRLAVALTSATLGVPSEALGVDTVVMLARAWTAPVAVWRRDHLSWRPCRMPESDVEPPVDGRAS